MKNLLKCHYNYLTNKTSFIIIAATLVLSLLSYIISLSNIEDARSIYENNLNYHLGGAFTITLISNFLSIFIFSFSFLSKTDQYVYLLLSRGISREKYFLTKIFTISLGLLVFVYFLLLLYLLVVFIGYKDFIFSWDILKYFGSLFLQIIFNGMLSLVFVQLVNNIYVILISFFINMIGTITNEEQSGIIKIINYLIPNFNERKITLINGSIYFIGLIVLLIILNLYIYKKRDL